MSKKTIRKISIILIWLIIWEIGARAINNIIVLSGPIKVLNAFVMNLQKAEFYLTCLNSTAMILEGFLIALLLGLILGALSYRFKLIEDFLGPFMSAIKSVPVASFVVILLIWFGSKRLSVFVSFLIVLPNIYVPTIQGLKLRSQELKNLAKIHGMSIKDQVKFIYFPALAPHLYSGLKVSIGLAFKSGVAAEVIGMSKLTLGERIYMSKVYLETDQLFAWTLMVIILSFIFEKVILGLFKKLETHHFKSRGIKTTKVSGEKLSSENSPVEKPSFKNICKSYNQKAVIEDLSIEFTKDHPLMLMAPSGVGKTTVLDIMSGIVKEDSGQITRVPCSRVFQNEIFIENYSGLENLRIFASDQICLESIKEYALKILPKEALYKPVAEYSGGMKRRLSVLRGLLVSSNLILLDEPFSGLDEENKLLLAKLIIELTKDKYLIFTGHYQSDCDLLKAERINLWKPE